MSMAMLPSLALLLAAVSVVSPATAKSNTQSKLPLEKLTAETTVPLRTHSLYAPYVDSDLQNRWWDFGQDAIVDTSKHVRLTQDRPSELGWLWSRLPLTASSYQIDFEFKVGHDRIDGKNPSLFGDGMAVWLTKERASPGPVFGNRDYFEGLGIFLDTYANSRHSYSFPRISAMMGDGRTSYDHHTDGANHEFAGCSANFRKSDIASKGRITYIQGEYLEFSLHYKAWDEWSPCFKINMTMPSSPYLGFTALTGQVSDAHDIISVSTSAAVLSTGNEAGGGSSGRGRRGGRSGGGGMAWFLFMIKGIAFLALIAFGWSGYKTWAAKNRKKARGRRDW